MSGIRIFINSEFKGQPDSAAERIARNLANSAAQIGSNLAVQYAKQKLYDSILPESIDNTTSESRLEIKPLYSPYIGADSRRAVSNAIVFQTNDKSVKVFLYDVRIDTTFENTIIKTPVTKRRGTIKEYIQAKDYTFSVAGNLISDSQYGFPLVELQEVIKLFDLGENFEVYSVIFEQFGVSKVILETATIPQSSAKYVNVMPFNIRLTSDEDYELTIEEEN